jgi:hypothetical protein
MLEESKNQMSLNVHCRECSRRAHLYYLHVRQSNSWDIVSEADWQVVIVCSEHPLRNQWSGLALSMQE